MDYKQVLMTEQNTETGEIRHIKKTIRTNIFQPASMMKENWFRKLAIWMMKMSEPRQNRFQRLHKIIKPYLGYPMLKLVNKIMGKGLVKHDDDIIKEWYNNHIRIKRYCYHKGVDDMWMKMHYNMKKHEKVFSEMFPTPESYLKHIIKIKNMPNTFRRLFMDIWINFMLEDTIDREVNNFQMLHEWHEMAMLYGVSKEERSKVPLPGQYPVYLSGDAFNNMYFVSNSMLPVWKSPEERKVMLKELKKKRAELVKEQEQKDKKEEQKEDGKVKNKKN